MSDFPGPDDLAARLADPEQQRRIACELLATTIGLQFRYYRIAKGYSVDEIAAKASVPKWVVRKLERGEFSGPIRALSDFAFALGLEITVTLQGDTSVDRSAKRRDYRLGPSGRERGAAGRRKTSIWRPLMTQVYDPRTIEAADDFRDAILKVRAGYVSQMKFCDIEPLPYFREFVRRLDAALALPVSPVPTHSDAIGETVEKLRELIGRATDDNLTDGGRYFHDSLQNLTSCYHGDTGEYGNPDDGKLVEFLWNNRRTLLTALEGNLQGNLAGSEAALEQRGDGISAALWDIATERDRQIAVEGWTPEHDDSHSTGELAGAAACYALNGVTHWAALGAIKTFWPWDAGWWKPKSRRQDLIRAGALIVAEIERLDRLPTPPLSKED